MRNNWVREMRDKNSIRAVKEDTTENVADVFTKCLSGTTIDKLAEVARREASKLAELVAGGMAKG